MKSSHDKFANVSIEFNSQSEAILSPDKTQKLLHCDHCGALEWKRLKLNQEVHNLGGSMYVTKILNHEWVEVTCFWAPWLKLDVRVHEWQGQLWAF